MGKYFASFFQRNGFEVLISDINTKLTNKELAKKADIVIVSVPIHKTGEIINEVAPHVKKTGLLFDLTSLKVFPMEAMKKTKASFLGCHPLFGPTVPIEGQLVIICPGKGNKWLNWLKNILEKNKVITKTLTAEKHDQMMAYVQALTHFSDIAMADTLNKSGIKIKEIMKYQSPVYRLKMDMMGRILCQNPNLYADIQIGNPLSVKVMRDYMESCKKLTDIVAGKDNGSFVRFFQSGSKYLGKFAAQAMAESDRLIKEISGTGVPAQTLPKDLAKKYDLAVLGPKNTYSDVCAKLNFPKARIWYTSSISDIFQLVKSDKIKNGFVPFENSLTGSVRETLDEFYEENIWIEKVVSLQIHLSLIGNKKATAKNIKIIYSHPQPLLQSRQYLKKNFPEAVCLPMASTAAAIARAAKENDPAVAAIGPSSAAKLYGLSVLKESIEDKSFNITYFALIEKMPKKPDISGAKKTFIAFEFKKDSPGSLFTVLKEFAEKKINLTKIESRPSPKKSGEYVFYADFEGNLSDAKVKEALSTVKKIVSKLKILGCY